MSDWKSKNEARKNGRTAALEANVSRAKLNEARRLRRTYGGAFGTEEKVDYNFAALGTTTLARQNDGDDDA